MYHMPVVAGILTAVIVVLVGLGVAYTIGSLIPRIFRIRPLRRWLRRNLIHSYTWRRISRKAGSSLLD